MRIILPILILSAVATAAAYAEPKKARPKKSAHALSAIQQWTLDDCKLWLVTLTPAAGLSASSTLDESDNCMAYFGEMKNGKPDGRGVYKVFPVDSATSPPWSYEGEFKDGKFHGQGALWRRGGQGYVGAFAAGEKHGQGKQDDGYYTYEGGFSHGKWTGMGVRITWSNRAAKIESERYEGDMVDGKPHGIGVWQENSADKLLYRYEGAWQNGLHHGKGIEFNGRWNKYAEGMFVKGALQGEGYRIAWGTGAPQRYMLLSGEWDGTKLVNARSLSWTPTEPQFSTYVPRVDGKR